MFLRNPWENITNKEIASLYLSGTSLGDTGSITFAIKFQLRDTSAYLGNLGHLRVFLLSLKIQKSS